MAGKSERIRGDGNASRLKWKNMAIDKKRKKVDNYML